MGSESISFEDWLRYLFDREPTPKPWYWDEDQPVHLSPALFLDYCIQLFSNSGKLLGNYSDRQINDGLYSLISNTFSDEIYALKNDKVDLKKRLGFITAIYDLNEQLFATRCTPHLSHLDKETPSHVSPLNQICYMWWDIFIISGDPEDPREAELNAACLQVMEKSLRLDNIAVQEGALHGLGHFSVNWPDESGKVIDHYLKSQPNIPPALTQYAINAKTDCIL